MDWQWLSSQDISNFIICEVTETHIWVCAPFGCGGSPLCPIFWDCSDEEGLRHFVSFTEFVFIFLIFLSICTTFPGSSLFDVG
ncbi:unknown [Methanothermobacter thermautotrophicus str. Delta H]|uniref:Uncharacterized protein n=1 Tax=Methanothermobacter thermautotrophicus (strain ATCC 29096 / DSM 1053 / JCM 10044 / NBRC 100330 / Delta H) TaxID=187420 RepID=O26213_METTH|nr:unknown [Methanothermobacter thermautotrophicus str. Delta H]